MRARLGSHREALLQFITDWSKIRRLLGRHLPTCFCSLGHELWLGVTRCRFCLGTNKKHSHKGCGLTKEASYFQRNRIAWYPAVLRHIAHGLDAMEARRRRRSLRPNQMSATRMMRRTTRMIRRTTRTIRRTSPLRES